VGIAAVNLVLENRNESYKFNNNNNKKKNSNQLFIIFMPSQQLQGQLQTQHSTDIGNYIMDKHDIKS
jgi:hypothetical protein